MDGNNKVILRLNMLERELFDIIYKYSNGINALTELKSMYKELTNLIQEIKKWAYKYAQNINKTITIVA